MSNVSSPRTSFRRCLLLLRPLFPSFPLSLLPSPEAIAFFFFFFFFFFHFSLFSFLVGRSHLLHLLLPHFPEKRGESYFFPSSHPPSRENIPRPPPHPFLFLSLSAARVRISPLENVEKSGLMVSSFFGSFFCCLLLLLRFLSLGVFVFSSSSLINLFHIPPPPRFVAAAAALKKRGDIKTFSAPPSFFFFWGGSHFFPFPSSFIFYNDLPRGTLEMGKQSETKCCTT